MKVTRAGKTLEDRTQEQRLCRRRFLRSCACAGLSAAAFAGRVSLSAPAKQPPNIILIMADDIAHDNFSCYGSETTNILPGAGSPEAELARRKLQAAVDSMPQKE